LSINLESQIQFLKGVGPKRAVQLARLGILKAEDILFHFPHRYDDRREVTQIANLQEGESFTVKAFVKSCHSRPARYGKKIFSMKVKDETGLMNSVWFSVRGGYFSKKYRKGMELFLSGRVTNSKRENCFEMAHPDIVIAGDEEESTAGILPVYPLTDGLNQKVMRKIVANGVELVEKVQEILPPSLLKKQGFPDRDLALRLIHNPKDEDNQKLKEFRTPAQKRMIFEEFFLIEIAMALQRVHQVEKVTGVKFGYKKEVINKILSAFPFELTSDQRTVLNEIAKDLKSDHPMNRLLQGDVGCGKTAVALITMLLSIAVGCQSAMMAPTEILAEQHYNSIKSLKCGLDITPALLVSGMKKKDKDKVLEAIASGEINFVIGTHALIQKSVTFKNLGVAVIDEQHRFGVKQRAELSSKGAKPNTLIMTATPIPRTLAMTVYSDLDLSIIKTMPKGRGKIETKVIRPKDMQRARILIHSEIKKGRQAYLIYPLVEESEKLELKAATEMYEEYRKKVFPDLRLGLVHGRMKSQEKNLVMQSFMNGEIDILVSTTVVEVGIDQPNATVMMIEHAERFGLAQLHQLRGRVGRGAEKSYCLLSAEYRMSDIAKERLKVMTQTRDGFVIAEKDLTLRGAGDLFGTKQSGLPTFRIANLLRDYEILKSAKEEAFELIGKDPELESKENQPLQKEIEKSWKERFNLYDVG